MIYNTSMEQYESSFEIMSGSAEEAGKIMSGLKDISNATVFTFPELAEAAEIFMDYGMSAEEAKNQLAMLGDLSAGSADKLQSLAGVYAEMSSEGQVQLEQIQQMVDLGFHPLEKISKSTGESMESLYERVAKGSLSVDEITASMERATSEGGDFFQLLEKQGSTVSGMMATITEKFQMLAGSIFEELYQTVGAQILPAVSGWCDDLTQGFKQNGIEGLLQALGNVVAEMVSKAAELSPQVVEMAVFLVGALGSAIVDNAPLFLDSVHQLIDGIAGELEVLFPAISPITDAIQMLIDNFDQALAVIVPLTAAFVAWRAALVVGDIIAVIKDDMGKLTLAEYAQVEAENLLKATMLDNPYVLVAMALAALVAGFIYLWNTSEEFRMFWINLWETIKTAVSTAFDAIMLFFTEKLPLFWETLVQFLSALPELVGYWLGFIITKLALWTIDLIAWIMNNWPMIKEAFLSFWRELPENIGAILGLVGEKIRSFGSQVRAWGSELKNNLLEGLDGLIDNVVEIGINIGKGLWQGFLSVKDWLMNNFKEFVNGFISGAKDALGIQSPSKEFTYIGRMCVAGFEEGMEGFMNSNMLTRNVKSSLSTLQMQIQGTAYASSKGMGNYTQVVNINQQIATPDELARQLRLESKYGLMRGVAYG